MKASQLALDMAKKLNSQLVALNVIVSQVGYAYSSGMFGLSGPSAINELLEKSRQEANKWFSKIQTEASEKGVTLKTEMVASPTSIVPAVVNYAEKNGVDLIVTGTKGRSGLSKALLGSVASGIVTYAYCPVMVVK
jgi:nucleotide-binding universal stress UspA family protein